MGAKNQSDASYISKQGIALAIGLGLPFTLAGVILAPGILNFMKAGPTVIGMGTPYLRIFFAGMTLFFVNDALGAIFRASGDTRLPTIAFAVGTMMNIFLDPLLIFGWGPFPELGVMGAAVATLISIAGSFGIFLILLFSRKLDFSLSGWYRLRPDFGIMSKIIKIGLPVSAQHLVFVMIYWFLIQIVHQFGDAAGAAMGIGNRMESLSYLTAVGFSVAAATLVGQNMGAGQPERAARCAWYTTAMVIAVTSITSVLFIAFPGLIAAIFTSDPEVKKIAVNYLIILGLSQIFMGIEIVLEGSFSGAGNTVPPMLVSIPGSILRLPLAYFLCFGLDIGINGIWWTLTITSLLKAAILLFWFKKGHWKSKKL